MALGSLIVSYTLLYLELLPKKSILNLSSPNSLGFGPDISYSLADSLITPETGVHIISMRYSNRDKPENSDC